MPVEDLANYLADLKKLVAPIVGPEAVSEAPAPRTHSKPRFSPDIKSSKGSEVESDTSFDFAGGWGVELCSSRLRFDGCPSQTTASRSSCHINCCYLRR